MMKNKTLLKSLNLLCHPLTLTAIFILLVNDHVLRQVWPSWGTGKIGDFAWLFFAPFAVAVCISALVPTRNPNRELLIGSLAFGFVGGVFVLANTHTGFNAWLVDTANSLLQIRFRYTQDPTDLIALPSLLAGWRLWKSQQPTGEINKKAGIIALSIAGTLTLANMAEPDIGIMCIFVEPDHLVAENNVEGSFISHDGGETWEKSSEGNSNGCGYEQEGQITYPDDPKHILRYTLGGPIEKTLDGGNTWRELDIPRRPSQAELAEFLRTAPGLVSYSRGPLHAAIDPVSGNVIFAMGQEGVFTLLADGRWATPDVGEYGISNFRQLNTVSNVLALIKGEIIVAVAFGILVFSTTTLWLKRPWPVILILIGGWLLFTASVIVFPPALSYRIYYAGIFQLALYGLAGAMIFIGFTVTLTDFFKWSRKHFGTTAILSFLGATLFLAPFILWTTDTIPSYSSALTLGYIMGISALILSSIITRRAVGKVPKEDRQDEEIE